MLAKIPFKKVFDISGLISKHEEAIDQLLQDEIKLVRTIIWPYNVMVHLLFYILDRIAVPEYANLFLIVRAVTAAGIFGVYYFSTKSRSLKEINFHTYLLVAFNAWGITIFMVLIGDPIHPYYIGHFLVCLGILCFLWRDIAARFLAAIVNLGPYILFLIYEMFVDSAGADHYIAFTFVLSFTLLTIVIGSILSYFRVLSTANMIKHKQKDLESRKLSSVVQKTLHDLKGPIGTIKLIEGELQTNNKAHELLKGAVSKLQSISSEILSDSDSIKLAFSAVGSVHSATLKEIKDSLKSLIHSKPGWVDVSVEHALALEDEKLSINARVSDVLSILTVLIDNAVENRKQDKSAEIKVNLKVEANLLIFSVENSEGDIAQNTFLESLVIGGSSKKRDGHGVGLISAKKMLDSLGGYIWKESSGDRLKVNFALKISQVSRPRAGRDSHVAKTLIFI